MKKNNLTNHQGENHQGSDHTAPYPVSRMAPSFDIVDLASEIAHADEQIAQHTNSKLKVIAEQIRQLQNQAKTILEQAQQDQVLHRAKCNFTRKPGNIYHLYEKPDGSHYFSMLSPAEWAGSSPHLYKGSYRLEPDMSWTSTEELSDFDKEKVLLERLMKIE